MVVAEVVGFHDVLNAELGVWVAKASSLACADTVSACAPFFGVLYIYKDATSVDLELTCCWIHFQCVNIVWSSFTDRAA